MLAAFTTGSFTSSVQTSSVPDPSKPPILKFPLASQPFRIIDGRFYGADTLRNHLIADDVALALQDPDSPDTAVKLLEYVFDSSSESELNEFIQKRSFEVRAISDTVKQRLAEKGISVALDGEGTIKTIRMTGEAVIHCAPNIDFEEEIQDTLQDPSIKMPKVLGGIVTQYVTVEQQRITYDNVFSSFFGELRHWEQPGPMEKFLRSASDQKKIHVVNFVFHRPTYYVGKFLLSNLNLRRLDLSGLKLSYAEIANTNLTGTQLRGAKIDTTIFRNSPIHPDTNLERAEFDVTHFIDSPIESGAVLTGTKFIDSYFTNSPIKDGAILDGAEFREVTFTKSKIGPPRVMSTKPPVEPKFINIKLDDASQPLPTIK